MWDGVCADLTPPALVEVTFNVDATSYNNEQEFPVDTLWATGSFENWSGYGVMLLDNDGDGVYVGSTEIVRRFYF